MNAVERRIQEFVFYVCFMQSRLSRLRTQIQGSFRARQRFACTIVFENPDGAIFHASPRYHPPLAASLTRVRGLHTYIRIRMNVADLPQNFQIFSTGNHPIGGFYERT